jgi:hypothetical protein
MPVLAIQPTGWNERFLDLLIYLKYPFGYAEMVESKKT